MTTTNQDPTPDKLEAQCDAGDRLNDAYKERTFAGNLGDKEYWHLRREADALVPLGFTTSQDGIARARRYAALQRVGQAGQAFVMATDASETCNECGESEPCGPHHDALRLAWDALRHALDRAKAPQD